MASWFALLPQMAPNYVLAYAALALSVLTYAGFWGWGVYHAATTPKATPLQRAFWAVAMFVNPSTTIWYWYIWKRWVFWLLFTPLLVGFLAAPFVVRSTLTHAEAGALTNTLYALGTIPAVMVATVLMVLPIILRLAALLHIGRNTELDAMRRNDWVICLALPIFGFGAYMAYAARYMRVWAVIGLAWWLAAGITSHSIIPNILHALIPAGEERREEIRALRPPRL